MANRTIVKKPYGIGKIHNSKRIAPAICKFCFAPGFLLFIESNPISTVIVSLGMQFDNAIRRAIPSMIPTATHV